MKKSELIEWLQRFQGDPEIVIEQRSMMDGTAREAQLVDEIMVVPDVSLSGRSFVYWEKDDPEVPARYPGDSPDDPEPVIALVLR